MSAFLGPIHYWLYNKIRFQEDLSDSILEAAKAKGWDESGKLQENYTICELKPLEELIDLADIHGWLKRRIQEAETRYAYLVTDILRRDPSRIKELEKIAFEFGCRNTVEESDMASDVYRKFDDVLLNGMPCDRVNIVTSQDSDCYTWEQAEDIHGVYWTQAGGKPANYYRLRLKVMEGMLKNSKINIMASNFNHYQLSRNNEFD